MKIRVNQEACIGCGACCAIAEELFDLNEEGLSVTLVDEVSEDQKEDCIDSCISSFNLIYYFMWIVGVLCFWRKR